MCEVVDKWPRLWQCDWLNVDAISQPAAVSFVDWRMETEDERLCVCVLMRLLSTQLSTRTQSWYSSLVQPLSLIIIIIIIGSVYYVKFDPRGVFTSLISSRLYRIELDTVQLRWSEVSWHEMNFMNAPLAGTYFIV